MHSRRDLEKLFPEDSPEAMERSLNRMVKVYRLVDRPTKGIYIHPRPNCKHGRLIEDIAKAMRPGCFNYVSLESALSEYSLISQVMTSRITIMTTGSAGTYQVGKYGTIEFIRTKRKPADIFANTFYSPDRPLRMATKETALEDLRLLGRNLGMVEEDEFADEEETSTET